MYKVWEILRKTLQLLQRMSLPICREATLRLILVRHTLVYLLETTSGCLLRVISWQDLAEYLHELLLTDAWWCFLHVHLRLMLNSRVLIKSALYQLKKDFD